MTNIYFVDFSLVLQVIDSEHLKTRLIFESLASNGQAEILRTISIPVYIFRLIFIRASAT